MKKKTLQNIQLSILSLLLCALLFEITTRVLLRPSERSYGILCKGELPPFKIIIGDSFHGDYDTWINNLIVHGKKITKGDSWGILSDKDPMLGYAPEENAISTNGWWQSNNIGARSRHNTPKQIPPGMQRILVFGDSFTGCSRVPQEETWPFFLNTASKNIEFLNFGVDGYGTGQCLLRYEAVKEKLDYDMVVLVFVPLWDPWRDINVLRQLNGWQNYALAPRFVVKDDRLVLIKSPYKSYEDLKRKNNGYISNTLRDHLRAYDRFYFRTKYESPPLIGGSMLYKLLARQYYTYKEAHLVDNSMRDGSEAMVLSRKIFTRMQEEAARDGKKFALIFLPDHYQINKYRTDASFKQRYDKIATSTAHAGIPCIDLMKDLSRMHQGELDLAYDGAHYGAKANKIIAQLILTALPPLHDPHDLMHINHAGGT